MSTIGLRISKFLNDTPSGDAVVAAIAEIFHQLEEQAERENATPSWDTIEIETSRHQVNHQRPAYFAQTLRRTPQVTVTVQAVTR